MNSDVLLSWNNIQYNEYIEEENEIRNGNSCDDYEQSKTRKKNNDKSSYLYIYIFLIIVEWFNLYSSFLQRL